jgi:hypothetical protein
MLITAIIIVIVLIVLYKLYKKQSASDSFHIRDLKLTPFTKKSYGVFEHFEPSNVAESEWETTWELDPSIGFDARKVASSCDLPNQPPQQGTIPGVKNIKQSSSA